MTDSKDHVVGSYPVHVHHGPVSGEWRCNSPYCEDVETDAPEDEGPKVIHKGAEPWRGH